MSDVLELGWEEWLALPALGLPAIKAKVDTGARTSALHAEVIETFGAPDSPKVRFLIQPDPDRPKLEIICTAPVVDRRDITSSNGQTELRYVIATEMQIGGVRRTIEITLTNRETMSYRMLLGRSAFGENTVVSPDRSFLQPKLSYDLYKEIKPPKPSTRPLRIALLTREPDNYSSKRLLEAARARGHVIDAINTSRCYMKIEARAPEVHYDGKTLPFYDAVIPRIGASMTSYGMAVLRQFQGTGAWCLNPPEAIGASRDKLLAHQLLSQAGIAMPVTAFAHSPKDTKDLVGLAGSGPVVLKLLESTQGRGVVLAETKKAAESLVDAFRGLDANFLVQEFVKEAAGADVRCLVIGGRVVAAMKRQAQDGEFRSNLHRGGKATAITLSPAEKRTAVAAAKRLGLNIAGVDILQSNKGPVVLEVNSSPGLEGIEAATDTDVAGKVIRLIEQRTRTLGRKR
ncbi:30S ribosomal protein S6--L-glutamate ligase [Henriciella mobilis]|uniref:Probable alpha-L-glutamate ligase n=1 Tax=Henriciella mobilis TaxID=2305467 RepID=A0A399RQ91_9PROT|nr:30S ribosomal protein S6--L-glutamate ligase [Henriciella mobilis]RIJ32384.1 30S ribosomal protein S6--L-glutamate ligase [Henriciella mobilis]